MLQTRDFDAAEMSLSTYAMTLDRADGRFIAIPAFVSRAFRHSVLYVGSRSGIVRPCDLVGKRFGVPEYQMTGAVWMRGILAEHWGVPVDSVEYVTGGLEMPGRREKVELALPGRIRVSNVGSEGTLAQMLIDGRIDALYSSRVPSAFRNAPGSVRRLFPEYVESEKAYFRQTRIFPIMHTVVLRRDVHDRNPWIANSLYQALLRSKRIACDEMNEAAGLRHMLPWMGAEIEWLTAEMGEDWWSYGLDSNRHVIDTFLRYHHDQGLSRSLQTAERLFEPEAIDTTRATDDA